MDLCTKRIAPLFEVFRILPGNVYMQMRMHSKVSSKCLQLSKHWTLKIALFIIVVVEREREKFQHNQQNSCNILTTALYFLGSRKVNFSYFLDFIDHTVWKLHFEESTMNKFWEFYTIYSMSIFIVHVHVTKMNWRGNNSNES